MFSGNGVFHRKASQSVGWAINDIARHIQGANHKRFDKRFEIDNCDTAIYSVNVNLAINSLGKVSVGHAGGREVLLQAEDAACRQQSDGAGTADFAVREQG
ncbi:hypothetical protein [Burkholderia lata]|uniref:hypothetical protein n=1 Tax=Burkholderia lata (strain ATCC 17760 / DSM 23089 / LMG 22485 / NCIMB 9086 / R18194 / 383) TaxID=482957 RepID=UPI0015833519|nr:hypothetical protein [Burkholderia lata]